jgi:hypothetical protein
MVYMALKHMDVELERKWKEAFVFFILRCYPSSYLKGLNKTAKTLSQDTRCPGRDPNLRPLEYEAAVIFTTP